MADREYILQVTTKMHCGNCTNAVETALRAVDGVKSATADLKSQTVRVVVNAAAADMPDSLIEAIEDAGFESHVAEKAAEDKKAAEAAAKARQVFQDADKNKNGFLTKSEIRKYFKKHPAEKNRSLGSGFRWNEFFTNMDKNGDNKFDVNEFTNYFVIRSSKKRVAEAHYDEEAPKKKETKYDSRFLYLGDPKSIIFAMLQLVMLTYVMGKMLKPDERLPLPTDGKYFAYLKNTFLQYGLQSGHMKTLETTLEAIINGETVDIMSDGAMEQIAKIALAISFIQGHVTQLTLPLYYFSVPLTRLLFGNDVCDGLYITIGKKTTSPRADEGFLTQLSLAYECLQSLVVMFFGSIALMHTDNLSQAVTQFFLAVMITDFSQLKDFTKKRGLKWATAILVTIKPVQRTLHLEGKEDIKALNQYSRAAEWAFFGAASIVTAKPSVIPS